MHVAIYLKFNILNYYASCYMLPCVTVGFDVYVCDDLNIIMHIIILMEDELKIKV